jgi:hypothetical protein
METGTERETISGQTVTTARRSLAVTNLRTLPGNGSIVMEHTFYERDARQCSWLRHYATSRKVASSSPDGVIEFFLQFT